MECLSYCLAKEIKLNLIEKQLRDKQGIAWERHWNAIEIFRACSQQYCYIFNNGTLVTWNVKRYQAKEFINLVKLAFVEQISPILKDEFSYRIGDKTKMWPHEYFNVDCITLEKDNLDLKLALSYGLSQSIKLFYYETMLEKLINRYNPLIQELSIKGNFRISRRNVGGIIGEILSSKSELNLTSNFLYQPKYFWQHPNLEIYYLDLERYLDITKRAENINQQIDTLNEIFMMFNSYLENKHSHRLEKIIIILIAVEVVFNFLNLHM